MKTLEKFKAQDPPKRRVSKIQKFKTEILDLYDNEYSVEQIQEYLLQNGVKVSVRRIYQFLKKNLNNQVFSLRTPSGRAAPKIQTTKQPAQNSKAVSAYMQKLQKIAKET
jgi:hypothetical protein